MHADPHLKHLIAAAAPLWAGEAELVRAYWDWPQRTVETDLQWLSRQCFKEFWGSGLSDHDHGGLFPGVLRKLVELTPAVDVSIDRHEVLGIVASLKDEFFHYCVFADAYDAIRPAGVPRLDPGQLRSWPEDDSLTARRHRHRELHGRIGARACKFTEGGYCRLFFEGMALLGRGGTDDVIAAACARVYDDEFGHMLAGIAGLPAEGLADADWQLLETLVVEQLRLRIPMRNAQFGFPLPQERVEAIQRAEVEPIAFDYARANLTD